MKRVMKDTGNQWLGDLPEHWSALPLGRIFEERREVTTSTDARPLSVTKSGVVDQLDDVALSLDGAPKKLVRKGDLAINSRSDRKGSSGLSPRDGSVSVINTVLRPVGIEPTYAHHLIRSTAFQEEFYRFGTGIVADLWTTRWASMKSIAMPVPPLKEQRAIAEYLDREIAEINAFINDQQAFRQLLLERWVSGLVGVVQPQLLEEDHAIASQLRPLWKRTRLKSTVESEKNGSWGFEVGMAQVTCRCIRVADFDKHSGRIHDRSETNRSYSVEQATSLALKPGDLLIEKSGGGPSSPVGNVVIYTGSGGDLYSNFVARIRLQLGVDPRFALYLHRALYLSGLTHRSIKQTTGIQNLDSSSYFNETIWLPPAEEQEILGRRIEAQRDSIDEVLKEVDLSIALAEERRSALISAAVLGQVDITNENSSAAPRVKDESEVHV